MAVTLEQARLGDDTPWPLHEVLRRLADAADHLLDDHNCDDHGWELVGSARDAARSMLLQMRWPAGGGEDTCVVCGAPTRWCSRCSTCLALQEQIRDVLGKKGMGRERLGDEIDDVAGRAASVLDQMPDPEVVDAALADLRIRKLIGGGAKRLVNRRAA